MHKLDSDDGDLDAASCKQLGHVDHGNHVSASHQREQEHVELSTHFDACGNDRNEGEKLQKKMKRKVDIYIEAMIVMFFLFFFFFSY